VGEEESALAGRAIGITADRRWEEQADLFRRRGATIVHGPTMTTRLLHEDQELRAVTEDLVALPPAYLAATTGIGIRTWMKAARIWDLEQPLLAALSGARIVARGPKAAGAVDEAGLAVWARARSERMEDVAALLLAEPLDGVRVAVQLYGVDAPGLRSSLADAGAEVVTVPVYEWELPADPGPAQALVAAAARADLDAVTFTSAPAVHNLFAIARDMGLADSLRDALNGPVVAACVGPVCGGAAREEGIRAPVQPAVGRLGLLVRSLTQALEDRPARSGSRREAGPE